MKIIVGTMQLAKGEPSGADAYDDGTIRLEFKLDNGSSARVVMDRIEAEAIAAQLTAALADLPEGAPR